MEYYLDETAPQGSDIIRLLVIATTQQMLFVQVFNKYILRKIIKNYFRFFILLKSINVTN